MQLFGCFLPHSRWMLLMVTCWVSCCVQTGCSSQINDEVIQDQPWTWNDVKYAVALGKLKPPLVAFNVDSTNDSEEQSSSASSPVKSAAEDDPAVGSSGEPDEEDYVYDADGRLMTLPPPPLLPPLKKRAAADHSLMAMMQPAFAQADEPRILPLFGSHAALSKLQKHNDVLIRKILRQAARRQSKKRSPGCMRKCIAQGLLHPAQCHSLC